MVDINLVIALIIVAVVICFLGLLKVYPVIQKVKDGELSADEIYESCRGWLLQAVALAEREFGGGTGKLKLSSVYAAFCTQVPWLAQIVSFAMFSKFVDDALDEMNRLLSQNKKLEDIIRPSEDEQTEEK